MLITNIIDEQAIRDIHDNEFPFPIIDNTIIAKQMCIENGNLVAAGFVRLTAEGILITDKNQPLITRGRAAQAIINQLNIDTKLSGLNECHVFVHDPKVQKFLRHCGFKDSLGGHPMIIHL